MKLKITLYVSFLLCAVAVNAQVGVKDKKTVGAPYLALDGQLPGKPNRLAGDGDEWGALTMLRNALMSCLLLAAAFLLVANDAGAAAHSTFDIGLMYENGWGVTKSKYVAVEWYIEASDARRP